MKIWSEILFVFLALNFSSELFAQNLVVNPDFEKKLDCPKNFVHGKKKITVESWTVPTKGTADYMHECAKRFNVSVPDNHAGNQKARSGKGYIHILAGKSTGFNYNEYIQGELSEPLKAGKEYEIEFWVSLGEVSSISASCLGMYLSPNAIKRKGFGPLDVQPQITCKDFISDTDNWVRISGNYTALGNEKHIIIGAFPKKKSKDYKARLTGQLLTAIVGNATASYYIDDVKVELVQKQEPIVVNEDVLVLSEPVVLHDVVFETASSLLLDVSLPELDTLISYLNSNQNIRIQLNGHTDDVGAIDDNQSLSLARVQSVREYLTQGGIAFDRIECVGFGSKEPIATNETEEGRQANRRVEFVILSE